MPKEQQYCAKSCEYPGQHAPHIYVIPIQNKPGESAHYACPGAGDRFAEG